MPNCNFVTGDAIGGTEKRIGYTDTRESCAALVYSNEPSANGVTYGGNDGGTQGNAECYAEFGATSYDENYFSHITQQWQACIFERKITCIGVDYYIFNHMYYYIS